MDERQLKAWREIAHRTDDPLANHNLTIPRPLLRELITIIDDQQKMIVTLKEKVSSLQYIIDRGTGGWG